MEAISEVTVGEGQVVTAVESAGCPGPISLAAARRLFAPETVFLNTATYGIPPDPAWDALVRASDEWRHGRCCFSGWDAAVGESRRAFARIHQVDPGMVAVGSQASQFVSIIAGSLEPNARVVCVEGDFTSVLFPFLALGDRMRVDLVPLDRLAESIDGSTAIVAFSAVQSADGRVADLDAICAAAAHHGTRVLVDSTQASGWMPIDASRFDYVVCSGYKWLLNPRGTAFMTVRSDALETLIPRAAGWYAADNPLCALYDGPLRLAADARRFDLSPAWLNWVGAAQALELLHSVGISSIYSHNVGLANAFRAALDLPPSDSAIVSTSACDAACERLRAAGVLAAGRCEKLRFAFHLYNDENDVERAASALLGRSL